MAGRGYYKLQNDGTVIRARRKVETSTITLRANNVDDRTNGGDGWVWYETIQDAITGLGIQPFNNFRNQRLAELGQQKADEEGIDIRKEYLATWFNNDNEQDN